MCKSFPVYSSLQGQKVISFAAIITVFTLNKFRVLHVIDHIPFYIGMMVKSLKSLFL